jgi:hypothetical protein
MIAVGYVDAVHMVSKKVRAICNFPLPPRHFWRRWINGCTIMEALLYVWLVALEVRSWQGALVGNRASFNIQPTAFKILLIQTGNAIFLDLSVSSIKLACACTFLEALLNIVPARTVHEVPV